MESNQSTSLIAVLARVFWMMAGPAALALLALSMADNFHGWLAPRSVAFLVVIGGIIIARRLDPANGEGEPTTSSQLRWHTGLTIAIGLIAWTTANALGKHWQE